MERSTRCLIRVWKLKADNRRSLLSTYKLQNKRKKIKQEGGVCRFFACWNRFVFFFFPDLGVEFFFSPILFLFVRKISQQKIGFLFWMWREQWSEGTSGLSHVSGKKSTMHTTERRKTTKIKCGFSGSWCVLAEQKLPQKSTLFLLESKKKKSGGTVNTKLPPFFFFLTFPKLHQPPS